MTNPLIALCLSFDSAINRVQMIAALGSLRSRGLVTLQAFDSAENAEAMLGRKDAIADVINKTIAHATTVGGNSRAERKKPAEMVADVRALKKFTVAHIWL